MTKQSIPESLTQLWSTKKALRDEVMAHPGPGGPLTVSEFVAATQASIDTFKAAVGFRLKIGDFDSAQERLQEVQALEQELANADARVATNIERAADYEALAQRHLEAVAAYDNAVTEFMGSL
jgi:hypothetical protein